MPDAILNYSTALAQFGLLGIFAYVVVWGTRTGFPRLMDSLGQGIRDMSSTVGPALVTITDRILTKIDKIEENGGRERAQLTQMFREQISELSRLYREQISELMKQVREDRELDRTSRHEQGRLLQKAIIDYERILQEMVKQVESLMKSVVPRQSP